MAICRSCKGSGEVFAHVNTASPATHGFQMTKCFACDGSGELSLEQVEAMERGRALRADRVGRGMSLRAEAARLGISAVELSRRERGKSKGERG